MRRFCAARGRARSRRGDGCRRAWLSTQGRRRASARNGCPGEEERSRKRWSGDLAESDDLLPRARVEARLTAFQSSACLVEGAVCVVRADKVAVIRVERARRITSSAGTPESGSAGVHQDERRRILGRFRRLSQAGDRPTYEGTRAGKRRRGGEGCWFSELGIEVV